MKQERLQSLQSAIDAWLDEWSDEGHDGWCHETLNRDMADAAALVYDASMKSSQFTERESLRFTRRVCRSTAGRLSSVPTNSCKGDRLEEAERMLRDASALLDEPRVSVASKLAANIRDFLRAADSAEKITFDPQPRELYKQVAAKYRPSDSAPAGYDGTPTTFYCPRCPCERCGNTIPVGAYSADEVQK